MRFLFGVAEPNPPNDVVVKGKSEDELKVTWTDPDAPSTQVRALLLFLCRVHNSLRKSRDMHKLSVYQSIYCTCFSHERSSL